MYKEIMCDFNNLYKAYKLAHRGKSEDKEVIEFDKNKIYNLNKILEYLKKKEWDKIFIYYRFIIESPKRRVVDALQFEGRIVQHVLCDNILRPYLDKRLVKENSACRKNKGTLYAIDLNKQNIVEFLKHHEDGYCLKMDVKKYFPSIDRTVLKNMFKEFPDDEIREFIYWIIDSSPDECGLPIGNQTSQWFALYYLNKVDRLIKESFKMKYYVRYMDDLIVIHEDKRYLTKLLNVLTYYTNTNLKLEFNKKTQIFPLHKGVSFLGWKFYYNKHTKKVIMKIDSLKKRFRNRKIRHIQENYNIKIYTKDDYNNRMRSVIVNLKHGDTYKYRIKNKAILIK